MISFGSLAFLTIFGSTLTMAQNRDDDICGDFHRGNYKTMRFGDGKIFLFKGNRYYSFFPGNIRNKQSGFIREIFQNTDDSIDHCFIFNGKVYYVKGDNTVIYENSDSNPQRESWQNIHSKVPHMTMKRNGHTLGFFVPPKGNYGGSGQSFSQANDLSLIAYGGGSFSTASVNGVNVINYNGYNIPDHFNAFMVNYEDDSITFFDRERYTVVKRQNNNWVFINGNDKSNRFEWKNVKQYFGC